MLLDVGRARVADVREHPAILNPCRARAHGPVTGHCDHRRLQCDQAALVGHRQQPFEADEGLALDGGQEVRWEAGHVLSGRADGRGRRQQLLRAAHQPRTEAMLAEMLRCLPLMAARAGALGESRSASWVPSCCTRSQSHRRAVRHRRPGLTSPLSRPSHLMLESWSRSSPPGWRASHETQSIRGEGGGVHLLHLLSGLSIMPTGPPAIRSHMACIFTDPHIAQDDPRKGAISTAKSSMRPSS